MAKKKKAAKKKAVKKSSKKHSVALVGPVSGEGIAVVPRVPRPVSEILADARKAVASGKTPYYSLEDEVMEASDVGSVYTRVTGGWSVKFVEDGVVILSSGPTIIEAILAHGEQIDHEETARIQRAADAVRAAHIEQQRIAAIAPDVPVVTPPPAPTAKELAAAEKKKAADDKAAEKANQKRIAAASVEPVAAVA